MFRQPLVIGSNRRVARHGGYLRRDAPEAAIGDEAEPRKIEKSMRFAAAHLSAYGTKRRLVAMR